MIRRLLAHITGSRRALPGFQPDWPPPAPGEHLVPLTRTYMYPELLAQLRALGDDGRALRQAVMLASVGATDEQVAVFVERIARGDETDRSPGTFAAAPMDAGPPSPSTPAADTTSSPGPPPKPQ